MHKALANNPALTANLVSTGLKNVPKSSPYSGVVRFGMLSLHVSHN